VFGATIDKCVSEQGKGKPVLADREADVTVGTRFRAVRITQSHDVLHYIAWRSMPLHKRRPAHRQNACRLAPVFLRVSKPAAEPEREQNSLEHLE